MIEWIKFTDKMPPLDTWVVATNGKNIHLIEHCQGKESYIRCDCVGNGCFNGSGPDTHWLFIEKLPKE